MSLTHKAVVLLDRIAALGGGALSEPDLREPIGQSHGTFSAARRELEERGFIRIERSGKITMYHLENAGGTASRPKEDTPAAAESVPADPEDVPMVYAQPDVERIEGEFPDVDAWIDALSDVHGSVDVNPSLVDNTYTVYLTEFDVMQVYHVSESAGGITVF